MPAKGEARTAKSSAIQVRPAILQAAGETNEQIIGRLGTAASGLTQAEAEQRARTVGLNEVAQKKSQGWPVRLLKIVRNPLVILLVTLLTISFATGNARAGTVMALMVALSVWLRFWQ